MSNLKWADVAHYYLKSGIDARVFFSEYDNETKLFDAYWFSRVGYQHPKITPILRALEDMTRDQVKFLVEKAYRWMSLDGKDFTFEIEPVQTFSQIGITEGDGGETWYRLRVDVESEDAHLCETVNLCTPLMFHQLILWEIDVFGLIESGQAIRKEVSQPAEAQQQQ